MFAGKEGLSLGPFPSPVIILLQGFVQPALGALASGGMRNVCGRPSARWSWAERALHHLGVGPTFPPCEKQPPLFCGGHNWYDYASLSLPPSLVLSLALCLLEAKKKPEKSGFIFGLFKVTLKGVQLRIVCGVGDEQVAAFCADSRGCGLSVTRRGPATEACQSGSVHG